MSRTALSRTAQARRYYVVGVLELGAWRHDVRQQGGDTLASYWGDRAFERALAERDRLERESQPDPTSPKPARLPLRVLVHRTNAGSAGQPRPQTRRQAA